MKKIFLGVFVVFTMCNQWAYSGGGMSLKASQREALSSVVPSSTLSGVSSSVSYPARVNAQMLSSNVLFNILSQSIREDNFEVIKEFITTKNSANAFNGNLTLLQVAVLFERPEIVAFLIERGADVNAKNYCGDTALHVTVALLTRKIQEELFSPVVPTIEPSIDKNALLYDILYQLLYSGASCELKNNKGEIPLDLTTVDAIKNILINVQSIVRLCI